MDIPYMPLGHIKDMLSEIHLDVSHFYEDLIFVESNAFLIQMGEQGKDITVYFNVDSTDIATIVSDLSNVAARVGFDISWGGKFELVQKDDNQVDVRFLPENP